jgi:hypothetical protein
VAPLAGDRVRAAPHPAVDDDAAADPGAEDHAEHDPVPAPAPSVASDSAKQLASFSTRTSRAERRGDVGANGCPFSTVELAFLIRPADARHRARRADADPGPAAERLFEVGDEAVDRVDDLR